jgi:hypothetical protein
MSLKPSIVYLQGNWKNNPDNMELQGDTGRIALIYYAKSVNMVAGGKGEGIVTNDNDEQRPVGGHGQVVLTANSNMSNKSRGDDLSPDGSFKINGQRLYNLAIHNDYNAHFILIDVQGKGFQLYTFTFG